MWELGQVIIGELANSRQIVHSINLSMSKFEVALSSNFAFFGTEGLDEEFLNNFSDAGGKSEVGDEFWVIWLPDCGQGDLSAGPVHVGDEVELGVLSWFDILKTFLEVLN